MTVTDQKPLSELNNLSLDDVSKWTVLIVDDEPDNRTIAEAVLSFNGAKVYTATQGAEGLKMLEDNLPSFVLLDLSMPVMDGWEMLKAMHSNSRTASIPVIALTAHAMAGDRARVLEAGFAGYIAKPFRLNSFMTELKSCFHDLAEQAKAQATE